MTTTRLSVSPACVSLQFDLTMSLTATVTLTLDSSYGKSISTSVVGSTLRVLVFGMNTLSFSGNFATINDSVSSIGNVVSSDALGHDAGSVVTMEAVTPTPTPGGSRGTIIIGVPATAPPPATPAAGGSATTVLAPDQIGENLTGTADGTNTVFSSSQVPAPGTLTVFVNMVAVAVASATGTTITLVVPPVAGSQVFAIYQVTPGERLASQLITDAMIECGIVAPGEDVAMDDLQIGMTRLNNLIDSNKIWKSAIFAVRKDIVTLIPGKATYTIGLDPNGILVPDFALPRPTKIRNIVLELQTAPSILRQPPMTELTDDQWVQKALTDVYAIPLEFYNDKAYPLSTLYFYPGPGQAYPIELWTWQQGAKINDPSDEIGYPPGYADFFLYTLAMRLSSAFQRPISPALADQARRATDKIVSDNSKPPRMTPDPAVARGNYPSGNWMNGWVK